MKQYKVQYEHKNGNKALVWIPANSEHEAEQKALMRSDVKRVIAVIKA